RAGRRGAGRGAVGPLPRPGRPTGRHRHPDHGGRRRGGGRGRARSGRSPALADRLAGTGTLTMADVAGAAAEGDPAAQAVVRDAARRLGQVLVGLVSFVNPGIVIIGGAPDGLGHTLLAEIRAVVYRRSAPLTTGTMPIVLSDLGERAGVVGAARLISEQAFATD
ncbi:ROK family protein, partial [Micromonospora sp. 4G55]|nr:ROK family protein [Micromonospora sp. 4G55]